MDIATLVGFLGGTVLVLAVMNITGSLLMYWDLTSILVVLGGSAFSVMMRWPIKTFVESVVIALKALMDQGKDPNTLIDEIIELAQTARKQSILALEKVTIENKYLAKAVKYMVDGYDPSVIDGIMRFEISSIKERHKNGRKIFLNLGEASPAFGMIGTVIGLIVIMANLTNPSKIGPGLAVALVTTLYGSLVANMFFLPIAQKLEYRSSLEVTNLKIIQEGVKAITGGENPRAIRDRLETFLSPQQRGLSED